MSIHIRRNSHRNMYDVTDDVSVISSQSGNDHDNHCSLNDIDDDDDTAESSPDNDDDSMAFPPGFSKDKSNVDIPAYFICPITKSIMKEPVIDREGNTYERKAIIRWLDLEDVSPLSRNPLSKTDLVPNRAVADAIEKARREAWFQYRKLEEKQEKEKERSERERRRGGSSSRKERIGHSSSGQASESSHRVSSSYRESRSSRGKEKLSRSIKQDDMLAANNSRLLQMMQEELDLLKKQQNDLLQQQQREKEQKEQSMQEPQQPRSSSSSNKYSRKQSSANTRESGSSRTSEPSPHRSCKSSKDPAPSKCPPPPPRREQSSRRRANGPSGLSASLNHGTGSSSSHRHNLEPSGSSSSRHVGHSSQSVQSFSTGSHAQSHTPVPSSTTSVPTPQPAVAHPIPQTHAPLSASAAAAASAPQTSSSASQCSAAKEAMAMLHNGWSVPIGVHKVTCAAPGLAVTMDVHRKSTPVKQFETFANAASGSPPSLSSSRKASVPDLVIPPGTYIDVIETQVHGGRIRGKVVWEVEVLEEEEEKAKLEKRRSSMMILRHKKKDKGNAKSSGPSTVTKQYTGWISLRWSGDGEEGQEGGGSEKQEKESKGSDDSSSKDRKSTASRRPSMGRKKSKGGSISPCPADAKVTDEDSGPWTQPVTLGVYRINFGNGLPLRDSPLRDSKLLGLLERGRYVEVVETQVKGDRVRARCIVPPSGGDTSENFTSGWISLFNAVTGSSGATLVPLGAYVTVSESGCIVTEGGSLDSKAKTFLSRGSCIEIVATRIEEGVVRGLVSTGGHVTLIGKTKESKGSSKRTDGSQETFLMPVPCGTYKILYPSGLPVSSGSGRYSTVTTKLKQDTCVEVVETSVEDGRVRGHIQAIVNGSARKDINGWISLFEPSCRWAKFVFL